jgi:dsDNA-specific endonuclease/ATPase MutS2
LTNCQFQLAIVHCVLAQAGMGEDPHIVPIEDAIDLHSFAPRDVVDVVEAYLQAACDAGFAEVRLIHGRGRGVQRAAIQRLLREHALVERYWDAPESHLGATVVRLRRLA